MATSDCVSKINELRPGNWKRKSKRGNEEEGIVRAFQAEDVPGVTAVVIEKDGELSVKFQHGVYYFELYEGEDADCDNPMFSICSKEGWDKNHFYDDDVQVEMPEGFYEATEGTYEYDGTKEEGAKKLLAAGFVPHPKCDCNKCKLWRGKSSEEEE